MPRHRNPIETSRIQSGGGPADGERVLFCAHAELATERITLPGTFHWHRFIPRETVTDQRTGETFSVEWFALCEGCKHSYKEPTDALRQDADWIGAAPNITRVI